jgi:hypothetical protein
MHLTVIPPRAPLPRAVAPARPRTLTHVEAVMTQPRNAMEIFRLLEKSNCRECGMKTCLAFAGAVYKGQRDLAECPRLDRETLRRYASAGPPADNTAPSYAEFLEQARRDLARLDLSAAAERTGGRLVDGRLTLKVLGKNVGVDAAGRIHTDIHINPWLAVPFYNYVLRSQGREVTNNWMSFRELQEAKDRYPLFQQRCEKALLRVADHYPDLFHDMVHLFAGRQVARQFKADISVVLHPLPKVPLMVCYWRPDEGLASSLNVYFDATAPHNLDIGSVFSLGAGITQMFEKLAQRHGITPPTP